MRAHIMSLIAISASAFAVPASAAIHVFQSALGPEVNGATGSGAVTLTFDTTLNTLAIAANWSGLSGMTTVAHIHCCTAAPNTGTVSVAVTPNTLPGFPTGVMSGSYSILLDLTQNATFTNGFRTNFGGGTNAGAAAALLAGLQQQRAYFNIHTDRFSGGEIRGFPQAVPEPSAWALLILGFGAIGGAMRRQPRAVPMRAAR